MITRDPDYITLRYTKADGTVATTTPRDSIYFTILNNMTAQMVADRANTQSHSNYLTQLSDYQQNIVNKPGSVLPPAKPLFQKIDDETGVQTETAWPAPGLPDPQPVNPGKPAPSLGAPVTGISDGTRKADPSDQLALLVDLMMQDRQDFIAIKKVMGIA